MPDGAVLKGEGRIPFEPPSNLDSPTFEEWAAMQMQAMDQQAVQEARSAVASNGEEE